MSEEPVEIVLTLTQNIETEGMKAGKTIDDVAAKSETAKKSMDGLGVSADATSKKVGAAASKVAGVTKNMNSLNMSVQQVARELPTLAISPQMFILAISNNLPILQDQLKLTRIENEALKASGQATVPVWRQVLKSITSWQTGLVLGITVLTVWGKEIFAATKQLFSFSDATKLSREEVKKFTTELSKGMGSELGKMDMMFDKLEKAKKGTSEYYSAKRDIIKQYGSYLSGLDAEITKLNNVEGAYKAIKAAIIETARDKALQSIYVEQGQKAADVYTKNIPKIREKLESKWGEAIGGFHFDNLKKELDAGKGFSYEIQRLIADFNEKVAVDTSEVIGTSSSGQVQYAKKFIDKNPIMDLINEYTKAENEYTNKVKDAQKTFGSIFSSNTPQIRSLLQEQQLLLDQAKLMPEATEDEIRAKNKKIEAIEAEIKRLNELGKTNKNELKSEQDYANKRQELIRAEVELQFAGSQAKIDAMKDGADKELAQMKLTHEKELAELDKQREDFAKRQFEADPVNKDKIFNPANSGLSSSQEMVFSGIKSDTLKNQQRELAEFYKKALSDYYSYAEAVNAMNEKFNSDKSALVGLGASKENLAELERQRNESLEKLSATFAEKSDSYENWLAGIAAMSLETLRLELASAQNVLLATTEGKSDNNNTEKVAQLRAKITVLEKTIRDLSNKKEKKEGDKAKSSIEDWKELREALADVRNEFTEIGNEIGGIGGEIISQSGQIAASTLMMIDGITQLANWSITATQMAAQGASKAIIAVEKASVILAIVSTAIQIASQIINLLKGQDKSAKDTEELKRTSEKISDVYEAINKQLEKRIDLIKKANGAEAEYLNTMNQKAIDEAKKYYKGLFSGGTNSEGRRSDISTVVGANSGLMSNEIFGKEGKNNDLSLKQIMDMFGLSGIEDFAKWWNEGGYYEMLTKGYTVTNQEYWDQLAENWNNLTEASEESAQAMQEQWAGFSFDSFKDKLDDLIKDVNTTAADIADSFTGTIEDSILNWVKTSYLDDEMQKWYDELASAYSDGMLTDDEYSQLEALYNSIYGKAQDMYDTATQAAGMKIDEQDRTASKKGIATASQDSVDENNGRLTAIQGMTYDIRNSNAEILSVQKDALNYHRLIKSQLDTIAENSNYLKHLEAIKTGIDDMNLKGVKIKT